MRILHIAHITGDRCSGVEVAVPQHVLSQQQLEEVAFVNVANVPVPGVAHQLPYGRDFSIKALPQPFDAPELVVFHEVYRPAFLKIAEELQVCGIPYIILPHGCLTKEAQHKKWLKKRLGNWLLFGRFIDGAVALQCLSEGERAATPFGVRKFIGTNGLLMPEKRKTAFRIGETRLLYVGRLDLYHKGLDLLLDAVAAEADFLREHRAALIVCGPDREGAHSHLQTMIAERHIGDIVSLQDGVVGEEKERCLLDADIFIQTSRFEGMPMGILEAAGYGLPCLLTRGTAIGADLCGAGGGWLAENTAESIADTLRQAIPDYSARPICSQRAEAFVRTHFAADAVAAQAIREYACLIGK